MKTRFDNTTHWMTATGGVLALEDMETAHLLNVYAMFVRRPERTMAMLIADIESCEFSDMVWAPTPKSEADLAASIQNVTKMNAEELVDYATGSPLGKAVKAELERRGVDISNALNVICRVQ